MNQSIKLFSIFLAVVALAIRAFAEDSTLSCLEVECPTSPGTTEAECTLLNETFTTIGLSRIPTVSSSLDGLSWVEGVSMRDSNQFWDNGRRVRYYDKNFYLGTPPSLALNNTGSCAVFFTQINDNVTFTKAGQGTCAQTLSDDCITALTDRAKNANVTGVSTEDACAVLQNDFQSNIDPACSSFAFGKQWVGIFAKPLSGPKAAAAITPEQNITSNCWPIIPKQDDLSLVLPTVTLGDYYEASTENNVFNVTPILTVFYPGNGSLVTQIESQITCMKSLDMTVAKNKTMTPGPSNESKGVQTQLQMGLLMTLTLLAALCL